MKSMNEITPESLDQNIQKLREEFNKKSFYNENHPKTSHEYKRAMVAKKMNRTNKALSANKIKWSNLNKLNDKEMLEFYRKHPGYLYYKEIMANMKIKQFNNVGKKRAFTGKEFNNKKIIKDYNNNYNYRKLGNTNYNHGNNLYKNFNINRNEKFPKISKTNYFNSQNKKKWKTNFVKNYNYNFNYNNYNYSHNHNYNYNINNININIKDKKNPYSLSWVNKILNQNDYKLEIKPICFLRGASFDDAFICSPFPDVPFLNHIVLEPPPSRLNNILQSNLIPNFPALFKVDLLLAAIIT